VSLFDRLASTNLTRLVFEIQKSDEEKPSAARLALVRQEVARVRSEIGGQLQDAQSEASRLRDLLGSADVIALNGGNPDFLKFVLMALVGELTAEWTARVEQGLAVFLARSAGAMVGGRDISLTKEPNPLLLEYLVGESGALHQGLGLAGTCTIRPHYDPSWDVAVALARQMQIHMGSRASAAKSRVVLVPDDEALQAIFLLISS